MRVVVDMKDVQTYIGVLRNLKTSAVPMAARSAINTYAFETQKEYRGRIKNEFINRNAYTQGLIRVTQSPRTTDLHLIQSHVGAFQPPPRGRMSTTFLRDQEIGSRRLGGGKEGAMVATRYASGQERGTTPRERPVRQRNYNDAFTLGSKKLKIPDKPGVEKMLMVRQAVKQGPREIFMRNAGKKRKTGIFRVVGGRRVNRRGFVVGAKLHMIEDLSESSIAIKPTKMLHRSVEAIRSRMGRIAMEAIDFQVKRILFRR
jgi:hypothetical protein